MNDNQPYTLHTSKSTVPTAQNSLPSSQLSMDLKSETSGPQTGSATIRKAVSEDEPFVYDLMCELEDTAFERIVFQNLYTQLLGSPADCLLVALKAGKPAGFLHLRMEGQLHHCQKVAEILELIVDQDSRGQKIGEALLKAAFVTAKENGCSQIELTSNQKRTDAHRFYRSHRMEQTHVKFVRTL